MDKVSSTAVNRDTILKRLEELREEARVSPSEPLGMDLNLSLLGQVPQTLSTDSVMGMNPEPSFIIKGRDKSSHANLPLQDEAKRAQGNGAGYLGSLGGYMVSKLTSPRRDSGLATNTEALESHYAQVPVTDRNTEDVSTQTAPDTTARNEYDLVVPEFAGDRDDLKLWLEITGYFDLRKRHTILAKYKRLKEFDAESKRKLEALEAERVRQAAAIEEERAMLYREIEMEGSQFISPTTGVTPPPHIPQDRPPYIHVPLKRPLPSNANETFVPVPNGQQADASTMSRSKLRKIARLAKQRADGDSQQRPASSVVTSPSSPAKPAAQRTLREQSMPTGVPTEPAAMKLQNQRQNPPPASPQEYRSVQGYISQQSAAQTPRTQNPQQAQHQQPPPREEQIVQKPVAQQPTAHDQPAQNPPEVPLEPTQQRQGPREQGQENSQKELAGEDLSQDPQSGQKTQRQVATSGTLTFADFERRDVKQEDITYTGMQKPQNEISNAQDRTNTADERQYISPPAETRYMTTKLENTHTLHLQSVPPSDRWRRIDLGTQAETKFFIIKSFNEGNVRQCMEDGLWMSSVSNGDSFSRAFKYYKNVIFFFSINKSKAVQGYARLVSPPSPEIPVPIWKNERWHLSHPFRLQWISTDSIPFWRVAHLRNALNNNLPIFVAKDGQEVPFEVGCDLVDELDMEADIQMGVRPPPLSARARRPPEQDELYGSPPFNKKGKSK